MSPFPIVFGHRKSNNDAKRVELSFMNPIFLSRSTMESQTSSASKAYAEEEEGEACEKSIRSARNERSGFGFDDDDDDEAPYLAFLASD